MPYATDRPARAGVSFTTRGDRFEATYNIPAEELPEGVKRKRITAHGKTKAEAQRKLLSKLAAANIQAYSNPTAGGPTFAEFLDEWVEDYLRYGLQESTLNIYLGHIEKYLKPYLGHMPLESITINDVRFKLWEKVLELKKTKNGVETDEPLLGPFAVNNLLKTLNMALEAAHEKYQTRIRRISKSYLKPRKISRPETNREIEEAAERVRKLFYEELDRDDPRWSHFMFVLLGLRQSERLGLQIKSMRVEGEKPTLLIYQQLDFLRDRGGWYLKDTTKNGQPRDVPLWDEFLEAAKKRLEIRREWSERSDWNPDPKFSDLLFLGEGGKLISRRQDTPMWHSLGLDIRGHVARHITGYLLAQKGVSKETAKKVLGHNSDAYAHYYRLVGSDQAARELTTKYNLEAP